MSLNMLRTSLKKSIKIEKLGYQRFVFFTHEFRKVYLAGIRWLLNQLQVPVSVISSDPPGKDDNARFTTVPLKEKRINLLKWKLLKSEKSRYFQHYKQIKTLNYAHSPFNRLFLDH